MNDDAALQHRFLQVVILGSAAGGGIPQWNCRCNVCQLCWDGDPRVAKRSQSSIAVSVDGENWLLINASPDLRQQILATPQLHPRRGTRHSPIKAVLVTNGDVDHTAGLFTLRENQPLALYGSAWILASLADNAIFDVLNSIMVERRAVQSDVAFSPIPGLSITLFPVAGKVPLWLEGDDAASQSDGDTTVGVDIEAGGLRISYIPGCAAVTDLLKARLNGADIVLFDGTVFRDDDMGVAGVGEKTGQRMGHLAMSGPEGSMAKLADVSVGRRIFVHINNTNPVLIEGSAARREIEASGWTLAHDGMVLTP